MSLKKAQTLAQKLVAELDTIGTKLEASKKRKADAVKPSPKKTKAQKLEANPKCEGNFLNADEDACKGGAKADQLVEWREHKVCKTCKARIQRWEKKNTKV